MGSPLALILERARECAAVEQEVLARDVAGLRAAKVGAGIAEFLDRAEAAGRVGLGANLSELVRRLSRLLRVELEVAAQPVGLERAGQEIVDGHVLAHGLAREAGDEPGQAGARAVREPELG